eukprot:CAMPEP_0171137638 /NCGR_PEP_ID=MMETSP0766_2-20121228/133687_1 /TAXON_ID=439317 /ORGANISM="Gambierdiscus australes, Strain CAWD 149" /LENGTH=95 /DNA_ID=CAMNT_0011601223 /DNA_START=13 /DNA_END=296 /DNA_ORIENTATION=-
MIGWVDRMLRTEDDSDFEERNPKGWRRFRAFNLPPRQAGRGMSEVLSVDSLELEQRRGPDPVVAVDNLSIDGDAKALPQPSRPSQATATSSTRPA